MRRIIVEIIIVHDLTICIYIIVKTYNLKTHSIAYTPIHFMSIYTQYDGSIIFLRLYITYCVTNIYILNIQ